LNHFSGQKSKKSGTEEIVFNGASNSEKRSATESKIIAIVGKEAASKTIVVIECQTRESNIEKRNEITGEFFVDK
jgi:hypothetical protein